MHMHVFFVLILLEMVCVQGSELQRLLNIEQSRPTARGRQAINVDHGSEGEDALDISKSFYVFLFNNI